MKTAIFFAFAFCFALALAEVNQKCETGDDCGDDECCMRSSLFSTPKCKKLREKEQFCFPNEEWNKANDVYRFMCPCVKGLVCKPAEVKEENGVTTYVNAKCVEQEATT